MGNDSATKLKRLRNQTEQLHRKNSKDFKKIPTEDISTLIHELQVHQIELEMQNDELLKTQMELEESRNKYMDLYDFASIGYFSFDRKGLILEVNLAGADLLGVEKANLLKTPFSRYITREDQDVFWLHHRRVFETNTRQICEVRLKRKDGEWFYARLETIAQRDSEGNFSQLRTAISDISELKRAEAVLRKAHDKLEEQVEERTAELRKATEQLKYEIEERKQAEKMLDKQNQELCGRVKELRCFYSIANLIAESGNSLNETFQGIVEIIPSAWQYPEITCARVILEGKEFRTMNFRDTIWKQTCDIIVQGERIGALEVCLVEERPEMDESSFLKEERLLINTIANRLAKVIEHQRAERALKESEEKYRSLVESTKDSIYLMDGDCRYLFINKKHLSRFGLPADKVVGRAYGEFHSTAEAKEFAKKVKEVFKTGKAISYEYRSQRDGGYYLRTLSPVKGTDGMATALTVVSKNITELKQSEKSLHESEEKYRLFVEHANDAIFVFQDGLLKFHNKKTEELLGFTSQELVKIPFSNHVYPKDKNMFLNKCQGIVNGDKNPGAFTFRLIKKTGEELWIHAGAVLIPWKGKSAVLYFARNITTEKRLEAQLQHSQKLEAMGSFAGGIVHDFNNLTTIINSYSNFALEKLDKNDSIRQDIEKIIEAVKSASSLTRNLLQFSSRQISNPTILDLNKIIIETLKMLSRLIGEDIELRTVFEPDLGKVMADPVQMEQILVNLAINARDAMPRGGILTIKTFNEKLNKNFFDAYDVKAKPGPYVVLNVSDTGIGMEKENLSRIFEPFYTTKKRGRGTGLGLSIVYGCIKQSGGWIRVYSKPGHGTIFKIYFPIINANEKSFKQKQPVLDEHLGWETILVTGKH
jgi:PAS domain S-box-containing protein